MLFIGHYCIINKIHNFSEYQKPPVISKSLILPGVFHKADDAAKRYGMEDNYVVGANIAGFEKVVDAMKAQGIV